MRETYVRINKYYYRDDMAGQTVVLVEKASGALGDRGLIGFPWIVLSAGMMRT